MSGEDRYDEIEPPEALKPFVRVIWTYVAPAPSGAVQRIAPDGCPELVFESGAPYEELCPDGVWRTQPNIVFAGQLTRPLALRPTGPVDLIAVRFQPDGARGFFGRPLAQATDRALDASQLIPAGLPWAAPSILDWLQTAARSWTLDPAVRAEVEAASAGEPGPARGPAERRALQRAFHDRVGVPPQTLRSVFRFRRVFDNAAHAADPAAGAWLRAGLDAGYFDQPQMARDFRRFLGCTATEWAREQMELARLMTSHSYKPGDPLPA